MPKAPLAGHPRRKEIEAAINRGQLSNDEIARHYDVGDGGPTGSQLVREHRLHRLHIHKPPVPPLDEALAKDPDPAIVPLPDIDDDDEWVCVWLTGAAQVGPGEGRWIGHGDVLTIAEAGKAVHHGNAGRIPTGRGLYGLYKAHRQRVDDLEALILRGDAQELQDARERIIVVRSAVYILPRLSDLEPPEGKA